MAELEGEGAAQLRIVTHLDAEGARVVSVSGELDSSNADRLGATMAALAADPPAQLIFDLAGLRFMDSAGIAVLVRAAVEVDTVQIRDPSPAVRRIIEVTGLTSVLRIVP